MDSTNQNIRASMEDSDEDSGFVAGMKLATGSALPMALRFAVELDLLQLISKGERGASASELAAQIPARNPEAPAMIDRVLRFLAANSVLTCTLPHGGGERRYSAAPVCKYLTGNEDGVSLAPMTLMAQDKVFIDPWYHLKGAVLEGGTPFERAHGMNAFEYPATDPRFNKIFNQTMYEQSTIFMKRILEKYDGFEGVKTLVDVGGGRGASLKMIISKHPSIQAINFDLPHVIQDALSIPGVEHIGGDMFVSVPRADAIFMKWICHDWSDSQVEKLLKNCYEALPQNGKVIVAETILSENPNVNGVCESWAVQSDVLMLAFNPGGKERTEMEFHALATKAGFKQLVKVCCAYAMWIMEFHKG